MMKRFNLFAITILILSALSACVTTKKKGEVSWAKRQYHNITTHYNFYFNANVLYEEALAKLNLQHQDNYNKILDLYPAFAVENAKTVVGADMDKAIKKVSTAATIHRKGDWVDNCYLLMGQSQFLKQDFESAEETFSFIVDEYSPSRLDRRSMKERKKELAKLREKEKKAVKKEKEKEKEEKIKEKEKTAKERKKEAERKKKEAAKAKAQKAKEKKSGAKSKNKSSSAPSTSNLSDPIPSAAPAKDKKKKPKEEQEIQTDEYQAVEGGKTEKPKRYFLKHRPSHQNAILWLAKTYIERQKYSEAKELLLILFKRKSTFPDVRREAIKTYALLFLKQKDYNKAIVALEKAIEVSKSKKDKARMYYILGQIHQNAGNNQAALFAFDKVLKSNTSYEMEFNARINTILFAYTSGKSSVDEATNSLLKMAKDDKNEDYLDQLYYTLAQIALRNNDRKSALTYLQTSLNSSKKNQSQKAESYLQIAQLYYEVENYVKAKNYYDSTLVVLNKQDERYDEVKRYATGLTDIAKNILIIQQQDSLIKVGALSLAERKELVKKKRKEQAEAAEKAAAAAAASIPKGTKVNTDFVSSSVPSSFFAYNPKSLQSGKRSFQKEWGTRLLEDNWRRANKKTTSINEIADNNTTKQEEVKKDGEITEGDLARALQGVPNSPEEVQVMNVTIANAYLNLGKAYREHLEKPEKCIKTLEELNTRFPESKYELDSWYYLYMAHTDLKQTAQAKVYYDKILAKYPTSTFARILTDPNFVAAGEKEKRDLNNYYKSTYDAFSKGQYKLSYEKSMKADSVFGQKNTFKAKFALLSAMSAGNIFGKEKYIALIKEVIAKFPETAEQKRAKEILRLLENNGVSTVSDSNNNSSDSDVGNFKVENEAVHYVVVLVKDKKVKLDQVKEKIGEFTREYYRLDNLKISNVFFGEESEIPLIVLRKFENKEKGMGFLNDVRRRESDFMQEGIEYEIYAITQNNYKELLKSKNSNLYKIFFDKQYNQN